MDAPITARDLLLAAELSDERARQFLASRGFRDPAAADEHLQLLAGDLATREALGALAEALLDACRASPDPDAALVGFTRYVATRAPRRSFLGYLRDDPKALDILTHVLGASPFLSEILIRNPEYFHWLLQEVDRPAPDLVDYRDAVDALLAHAGTRDRQIDALKRFKRRETLRLTTRDLLGRETVTTVTEQISNLADIVADGALRIVSEEMCRAAGLDRLPGAFAIIGMGKLGGRELNYSSDIDLIYLYDSGGADGENRAHTFFQTLAKRLTALLSEHTGEGYLYRVDLRLRPMGRRGNLAYSLPQCQQYYESLGETFERFALIKARPMAGDPDLGRRFVEMIRPFVYRKYLDHAAIEELARYKARVDRDTGGRADAARNVKTGRGGIREIELFVQVFQLIYGATDERLQQRNTLRALAALRDAGFIEAAVAEDLTSAYEFLRTVEHRLQIVQEGQTHTLSAAPTEREITARRIGFQTAEAMLAQLDSHRTRVHAISAQLLERRSDAAEFHGRQFFRMLSGELADHDAVEYLRHYKLPDPEEALRLIRALDEVPTLAHSRSALRNLLANLLAVAMADLAASAQPGRVLNRLERLATVAGGAAALFRTLLENDELRERLIGVLDAGDLFADRLARYPETIDFLAQPARDLPEAQAAVAAAVGRLDELAPGDRLDQLRRVKAIEEVKLLIEWLQTADLAGLQQALTVLADRIVTQATQWEAQSIGAAGVGGDRGWAVLALGKLGGRELSVHSDLDLVFVYRGDPQDSDAFERLQAFVRRVSQTLEAPTAEGFAYRLDTRLRPEGSKGALATPVAAFVRYLETRAETWERMAWTRGRFLAGDADVGAEAGRAIAAFVYGDWDPSIPGYVRHVRTRMEKELADEREDRVDFKVGRGGLADIDFALQLVQMREGRTQPAFRVSGTRQLLAAIPPTRFLEQAELATLGRAHEFLRTVEILARIAADGSVGWLSTDTASLELLGSRLRLPSPAGESLLRRYREVTSDVRAIYERVLERLEVDA